jgi:hypothetical protein
MALLQLAEGTPYLAEDNNPMKDYIFIPAGMLGVTEDTYVRQDFFDGLQDKEYEAVITSLAPFQNTGISSDGSLGVVSSLIGGIPVVGNTGKAIFDVTSKLLNARKKRVETGKANPILKGKSGSLISKVKGAVEKVTGKMDQTKKLPAVDVSGSVGGTTFDLTTGQTPGTESFFTKYKTPIFVVGGLGLGFLIYKVVSKKK